MNTTTATGQQAVVDDLVKKFSIDADKVLFLNPRKPLEPWLNAEALTAIARQSGEFRGISEGYDDYIEPLKQVVHVATVTDKDGRIYTRSGAAALGEKLPNEQVADEHALAAARCLRSALDAAGFDPVKAASVVSLELKLPAGEQQRSEDIAAARISDLRQIHILAAQKGLIVPMEDDPSRNDMAGYRSFLAERFDGANSVAGFGAADRAIVINLLRDYEPAVRKVA